MAFICFHQSLIHVRSCHPPPKRSEVWLSPAVNSIPLRSTNPQRTRAMDPVDFAAQLHDFKLPFNGKSPCPYRGRDVTAASWTEGQRTRCKKEMEFNNPSSIDDLRQMVRVSTSRNGFVHSGDKSLQVETRKYRVQVPFIHVQRNLING